MVRSGGAVPVIASMPSAIPTASAVPAASMAAVVTSGPQSDRAEVTWPQLMSLMYELGESESTHVLLDVLGRVQTLVWTHSSLQNDEYKKKFTAAAVKKRTSDEKIWTPEVAAAFMACVKAFMATRM